MKKFILLCPLLFLILHSSCGIRFFTADESEEINFVPKGYYDKIQIWENVDVEFTQGNPSITVIGPKNAIELLKVNLEDGVLDIDFDPERTVLGGRLPFKVIISNPQLKVFDNFYNGNCVITNVRQDSLIINSMSHGNLTINNPTVGKIILDSYGNGTTLFNGLRCDTLFINNTSYKGKFIINCLEAKEIITRSPCYDNFIVNGKYGSWKQLEDRTEIVDSISIYD